jgi:predicted PurR-regulated permease PerM
MTEIHPIESPRWNWATKLVVALTAVAIIAGLVLRFRGYLGPILLAVVLSYLSYPLATKIHRNLKISWRISVGLVYLVIVIVILGLLTLGGLAIIEQSQSLYDLLNRALFQKLPDLLEQMSSQVYTFWIFELDLRDIEIQAVVQQILGTIQPLLGQVGVLLTRIATGAFGFLGWVGFVLLISYFITSESGGISNRVVGAEIPGYSYDLRRFRSEFGKIWNAFLRGQLILFFLSVSVYTVVLTLFGVRFSFWLALLAGFGRFLPYVGPALVWTVYALVTFFQGSTLFNLSPLGYTALVLGVSVVIDSIFDNYVSPRFLGYTLKVHPAAVLIAALIAANIIGIVGVLLAAPVLATLKLLSQYTLRKMFDMDPWEGMEYPLGPEDSSLIPSFVREKFILFWQNINLQLQRVRNRAK